LYLFIQNIWSNAKSSQQLHLRREAFSLGL
jgi:hypothetical protein